ncbi:MAG TPA: ABC transporter permease [Clostridiales bacterium]|nr:ABC transporter permease [Clostridiales bacterium]
MTDIITGILEEGLTYAIMALGVYLTYRILNFPDLSVDGTFPLGGAVTAALLQAGVNPLITLPVSFFAGAAAGMLTGLIHIKLRVRDLLSGIIMMTALYSLNLRIAGRANVPVFSRETIFDNTFLDKWVPTGVRPFLAVLLLFLMGMVMKRLLDWYLGTKSGSLLRAAGDNEALVTSLAKDKGTVKIIGLSISNAFVALSGCLYCQKSGFFEISTGTGTMVIGLASVIIGMKLFQRRPSVKATTAVIFGSIVYKTCVSAAIFLGMAASDLKLITAVLFLLILAVSNGQKGQVTANA